jgi:hypothetical protein
MGKIKSAYKILIGKLQRKIATSEALPNGKLILKDMLEDTVCACLDKFHSVEYRTKCKHL